MKFRTWIAKQGGPRAVARLLKTESPTVYAWLRGDATPRVLVMQRLVELGKGAFDYGDIISETKRKPIKKSKRGDA